MAERRAPAEQMVAQFAAMERWVRDTFKVDGVAAVAGAKGAILALEIGGSKSDAASAASVAVDMDLACGHDQSASDVAYFSALDYQNVRADFAARLLHMGWRPGPVEWPLGTPAMPQPVFWRGEIVLEELVAKSGSFSAPGGFVAVGSPAVVVGSLVATAAWKVIAAAASNTRQKWRVAGPRTLLLTNDGFWSSRPATSLCRLSTTPRSLM